MDKATRDGINARAKPLFEEAHALYEQAMTYQPTVMAMLRGFDLDEKDAKLRAKHVQHFRDVLQVDGALWNAYDEKRAQAEAVYAPVAEEERRQRERITAILQPISDLFNSGDRADASEHHLPNAEENDAARAQKRLERARQHLNAAQRSVARAEAEAKKHQLGAAGETGPTV